METPDRARVLDHGLPPLPGALDYTMSLPVAFWASGACAVVMFLEFRTRPVAMLMTFTRDGGRWSAHRWAGGVGWSHDPAANPGGVRDLGGQVMTGGSGAFTHTPAPGHPAVIVVGRVAPAVRHIALIQDGHEDRRPLRSHFGAWVVCTERWSPYQISAIDGNGTILDSLHGPSCLPPRAGTSQPGAHGKNS